MANSPANANAYTLGTWGLVVHSASGDTTPPDPPTVGEVDVGETEATMTVTEPAADFDHMEAWYGPPEDPDENEDLTFDGTFTGLTPGTRYFGGVVAVDAAGNRSSVVPFEFTTLRSIDGTYNYTVTVTASNVGYADFTVAQDCDIDNDRSRVPAYERGERVEIDIEMTEESQSLEFIGYTLPGVLLRRRVE